jgi:hypothetical protein
MGQGALALLVELQILEDVRPIEAEKVAAATSSRSLAMLDPASPPVMYLQSWASVSTGKADRAIMARRWKNWVRNPVAKLRKVWVLTCAQILM